MMRKLDQRGAAAFELVIAAAAFFTIVPTIFDLGRYAITVQSLRFLANAGARQVMIDCYTPAVAINNTTPACSGDPLPTDAAKQNAAPLSFVGTTAPTLTASTAGGLITVTASQSSFQMIMPIWPASLNNPSVSTKIPF